MKLMVLEENLKERNLLDYHIILDIYLIIKHIENIKLF